MTESHSLALGLGATTKLWVPSSDLQVKLRVGIWKHLIGEDSQESLVLQGDQTSQSYRKLTLNVHWKD